MPGRKRCAIYLAAGITARSKLTVIDDRRLYAGVVRRMDQGLTMRGGLIGRLCWTTPGTCVKKLSWVS